MSTDPASLNIDLRVSGLDQFEAATVIKDAPAGRTLAVEITQPALGGRRFAVAIPELSTVQAADLLAALRAHSDAVWASADHVPAVSDAD